MGFRPEVVRGDGAARDRNPVPSRLIAIAAIAIAAMAAWVHWSSGDTPLIDADDAELVALGKDVYATHCAACHGARLEGQPDWRQRRPDGRLPAPPHDASGHTWHHPDAMLIGMVSEGFQTGRYAPQGYSSDMPSYGASLSEKEIIAVLAFIKSHWPLAERAHQERITRQAAR